MDIDIFKKLAAKQNGTQLSNVPLEAYLILNGLHCLWGDGGYIKKETFEELLQEEVLPKVTFKEFILSLERFPEDDDFIDDIE